jgi:hypothetical protein
VTISIDDVTPVLLSNTPNFFLAGGIWDGEHIFNAEATRRKIKHFMNVYERRANGRRRVK